MRRACRWVAWSALAATLLAGCGSDDACAPSPPSESCADLEFRGERYHEWRAHATPPPARMQEVGNATYPACNVPDGCPGSELDGFGATDVYLIPGVETEDAVLGFRQNSDQTVIFVRIGLDAEDLPLPE